MITVSDSAWRVVLRLMVSLCKRDDIDDSHYSRMTWPVFHSAACIRERIDHGGCEV
ncbi:MAG: hypothetical protein GY894_12005 [Planctomycetes bacterium]|nr:hypothetical protein [Planctomycetota bacterium]MCP4840063.1 hypothetical protein [Planctomycetota bacterium]